MLDKLLELDTQIFLYLNSLGSTKWDGLWLFMTNAKTWILLYVFIVCIIGLKVRNWLKTIIIPALLGGLVGINDGLSNIAKQYFERPRPCRAEDIFTSSMFRMVADNCSKYGYFSAYASNNFGLAVFLGYYFKPSWKYALLLFLIWASLVAYSRIYIGVHYPLDILTGGFVGCFFGYLFIKILKPLSMKFLRVKI